MRTAPCVLFVVACAAVAMPAVAGSTWPFQSWISRDLPAAGVAALEVREDNGDIHLSPAATDVVTIRAHVRTRTATALAAATLDTGRSGNRMTIGATCPNTHRLLGYTDACVVDYEITYPKGLALDVHDTNGNIRIDDPRGAVKARDTNGDVTVNGAATTIDLSSRRGDVTATLAAGWAGVSIALSSSEGDVSLAVPRGLRAYLTATTHLGDIDNSADLPTTPRSGATPVRMSTILGDVTVTSTQS